MPDQGPDDLPDPTEWLENFASGLNDIGNRAGAGGLDGGRPRHAGFVPGPM